MLKALILAVILVPLHAFAGSYTDTFRENIQKSPQTLKQAYKKTALEIHQDSTLNSDAKEAELKALNVARQELESRYVRVDSLNKKASIEEACEMDLWGRKTSNSREGVSLSELRRSSLRSLFEANTSLREMISDSFKMYFNTIRNSLLPDQRTELTNLFVQLQKPTKDFWIDGKGNLQTDMKSLAQAVVAVYQLEYVRQIVYEGADYAAKFSDDPDFRYSRKHLAIKAEWVYMNCIPFHIFSPRAVLAKEDAFTAKYPYLRVAFQNASLNFSEYLRVQEEIGRFNGDAIEPFMKALLKLRTPKIPINSKATTTDN